jgi:hypothetical protein
VQVLELARRGALDGEQHDGEMADASREKDGETRGDRQELRPGSSIATPAPAASASTP